MGTFYYEVRHSRTQSQNRASNETCQIDRDIHVLNSAVSLRLRNSKLIGENNAASNRISAPIAEH